jgi:hypothetical protein
MLGGSCSACCNGCALVAWDLCSSVEVTLSGKDILEQYEVPLGYSETSTRSAVSRGFAGSKFNGTFSLNKIGTLDPQGGGFFRRSIWQHDFDSGDSCGDRLTVNVYNTPLSSDLLFEWKLLFWTKQVVDYSGGLQFRSLEELQCSGPLRVDAGNYEYISRQSTEVSNRLFCSNSGGMAAIESVSQSQIVLNEKALTDYRASLLMSPSTWPYSTALNTGGFLRSLGLWYDGFGSFEYKSPLGPQWSRWRPRGKTGTSFDYQFYASLSPSYLYPDALAPVSVVITM